MKQEYNGFFSGALTIMIRLFSVLVLLCSLSVQAEPAAAPTASANKAAPLTAPYVAARSYYLLEAESGQPLAALNADQRIEPASLTKLMSAYLVFQAIRNKKLSVTQAVPVSQRAWKAEGSRMFIEPQKPVSVDELLHGMIIQSGNDATTALAEAVSGSEEGFAQTVMIQKQAEFQRGIIAKLRAFKADGRVILGFKSFDSKVSDLPDFPLEDGDKIFIPEKSTTVSVLGSVFQQNTFIYQPDYKVNDYLEKAGGVSPSGDKSMMYRICADGSVQNKMHGGWRGSINPGDAIVVPEKIVSSGPSFVTALKDWTTILYQFGLGAAGLKTLKN